MDHLTQTKRQAGISITPCLLACLRDQRVTAHRHPLHPQAIQSLPLIEHVRSVNGDVVDDDVEAHFGYGRHGPVVRALQPTTDITNTNLYPAGGWFEADPIIAVGALNVSGAKPLVGYLRIKVIGYDWNPKVAHTCASGAEHLDNR